MFYAKRINVPAKTSENNPKVVEIPLKEKWIEDIWIGFEDGCAWMVGVRIYYGIRRWFPENEGEWIWGNDVFIPLKTIVQLPAKTESIKVYCISPNTKYDHDIIVYVWTSEEEIAPIQSSLNKLVKGFGF